MKRLIVILFLAGVAALLYADRLWPQSSFEARAQGKGPKNKYGSFTHKSHMGDVKVPGTAKTQKLDCASCHTITREKPDVAAYPNTKPGDSKTHSACTDCHEFTGRQAVVSGVMPAMCLICHSSNVTASAAMKKNLRGFPNPTVEVSQFGDAFSHKTHKDYLDKFNCSECHTLNQAPVTILGAKFSKGEVMSSPGHPGCFTCHFDEKTITKKSPTFALNCVGCHADLKPAKGKAPDPAVLFFKRRVVEPVAPAKPFSHEDHSSDGAVKGVSINNGVRGKVSNQTKECMSCHLTGMTADKRADFYFDPKTKTAQPAINGCKDCAPVNGCLNCHQRNTSQKIEGAVKLETSKCTFCHSVPMMKAKAASGLPPASHFGQAAATATTPATPAKPEVKPEPKPAAKPEARPAAPSKPETKPEVKIETKPAPKPEPPKETPKPETKPEPKPENKPAPATPVQNTPAPKPEPPKQTAAPAAPATAAPTAVPAAKSSQPLPTKLKLGDPNESKIWGQDAKWGVVDFDHTTHIKPSYAERCEVCHHTNKDAKVEMVPKCITCHLDNGNPKNPKSKGGDEVDVKLAYHGDPNNTSNNAGCIVCHQRAKETKPDANAPTKCAECHALKQAQWLPRWPHRAEKMMVTQTRESWYPQARQARSGNNPAASLSWSARLMMAVVRLASGWMI